MNYQRGFQGAVGMGDAQNCAGSALVTGGSLTVAQNIDNRINGLREQIARLEQVKAKLSMGIILDVSMEDLQMALSRY